MTAAPGFDYEQNTWGQGEIPTGSTDFLSMGLHLRYCLDDFAPVGAGERVLEVGCGQARFGRAIARARSDLAVTGVDVSSHALAGARARGATVLRGRVEDLPFPTGAFGAVLAADVIEHLLDPVAGLAEIRRVLMAGGVFHLIFPCEGSALSLHGVWPRLHELKRKHAGHLHRLTQPELYAKLHAAGFFVEECRRSYHLFGQIYDAAVFLSLEAGLHHQRGEDLREGRRRDGLSTALQIARGLYGRLMYAEAVLCRNLPTGMNLHLRVRAR